MSTFSYESRCDESIGFPLRLRPSARALVGAVATGEIAPPLGAFNVAIDGEALRIPYRLYYNPARLRDALANARGIDQRILACLGTRHYDGRLRQECLARILDIDDAWLAPYVVQLAGEYVIEIVDDVARAIGMRVTPPLAAFARDNPDYLATLSRRVTSYWNCYHRREYPDRAGYPGTQVLRLLQNVPDTPSR